MITILLRLHNPVPYVVSKHFSRAKFSILDSEKLRATSAILSILAITMSRWLHRHGHGREGPRPHISCSSKQMPIWFLIHISSVVFWKASLIILIQVWWVVFQLLYHVGAWTNAWGRWSSDLSFRLHFVEPPKDPVAKTPTNFNISFLYLEMNFECHIEHISCSSEIKISISIVCNRHLI